MFHRRPWNNTLGEEFAEDFERIDIQGGFAVKFYVAEDFLRYFVSECSGEGDQHRFCEGEGHKALSYRIMVTDERGQVLGFGTEAEGYCKFEEEADVEIAEVSPDAVQQEDILFAPLEKSLLGDSVPDYTVEDFAEEHCHRVLEDIVPYPQKGVLRDNIAGREQVGSVAFQDIGFEDIEREEEGHCRFLADTSH